MTLSESDILPIAQALKFDPEMVEKVVHLLNLLNMLNAHPFLKGKWTLKGGTALNLFVFNLPRLSVDIGLNYMGALDRDGMLQERPKIEQAAQAVFSREGFILRRIPKYHAGGKWMLRYQSFTGRSGNLEVDMNFMFRQPLWQIQRTNSIQLGSYRARGIPILDIHELAAGKIAALLSRVQARDLFDCHRILTMLNLDKNLLRIGFVAYGGMNRKDWRTVSIEDVEFDPAELAKQLLPTLRGVARSNDESPEQYGERLVAQCRSGLSGLLAFTEYEREFLDRLLDEGRIDASLLTEDAALKQRIESHPLLEWKALNVRRHKGLS